MIFDFPDANKLWCYKFTQGIYCVIFYEKNNQKNKELYINLTKMLLKFDDLPFLRAEFNDFKQNFQKDNVTFADQILILDEDKSIIKEIDDYQKIPKMLLNIREIMLEKKKRTNVYYQKTKVFKTWSPASRCFKYRDIIRMKSIDVEILYKFPNITYLEQKLSNIRSEKPKSIPSTTKSKKICKRRALILKSTQNNFQIVLPLKINISLASPSTNEFQKSQLLQTNILKNSENPLDMSSIKIQQKIQNIPLNNDQPIDLSIPKTQKSSAVQIHNIKK